jgi:ATP-dependent DNA helicase RecG
MPEVRDNLQSPVGGNQRFPASRTDTVACEPICNLEGTQQSGIAFDLKIADIARDGQIMAIAREEAQKIIDADPTCTSPEYAMLWRRLRELRDTNVNWAAIS